MQWEIILLLVIASPFVFYYVIRHGIGRLKKHTMEKRSKNEIAVGQ
jgi:hypothetical protein